MIQKFQHRKQLKHVDTEVGGLNSVSGNFTIAGISTVTGTTHSQNN